MPSTERDESRESRSRDRDSLVLKHQHSFSESGRASVPMWDSSDPERAPPPLPLNPGASSGPATRQNTSARIEEAAALITAKARDNVPSGYTTNVMASGSPEKNLITPHHRRMQSVQNGNVRGLSDSLERRSPDKSFRTPKLQEHETQSGERSPTRAGSETPTPSGRATPNYLNKSASDENTPPSDRMLALQSIRTRAESEAPLSNITNSSNNVGRGPHTIDGLSSQILSLTSIATSLQKEMAALSRRSRDNATDLVSLKEATNLRDEDIRKSLKDLVVNLSSKPSAGPQGLESAPTSGLYLDNKAYNVTPGKKAFSLPRIPSPNSFTAAAMERELTASPSAVSSDGAASIALLEKVLREMGTKDGQDAILKTLEKVKSISQQSKVDPSLMTKLEEILQLLKDNSASGALVRSSGAPAHENHLRHDFRAGPLSRASRDISDEQASDSPEVSKFINDEIVKILKGVKQSVSEGGGLTNEVKALVRELRGEVLGMGREIARKLEQAESSQHSARDDAQGPGREEIGHIVDEGLHELRQNMDQLIRENRRQSATSHKSAVDTQEVVLAVQRAFAEIQLPNAEQSRDPVAEREQMLAAVREAWEECKPEIALEHFGLERDEILDTLKEGLHSYQSQQSDIREVGASYDEVLEAVKKGLADFRPPPIETEASLTREEILMSVRECLESFEFPVAGHAAPSVKESDLTREDVLDAVREGMTNQSHITKEIEFSRDDLFDAVKAGLEGAPTPMRGVGEQVLEQMHEFLASMKSEFRQYSAANGKDTEQVLDAMKDGFEGLRGEIESYVDRAADVTGRDEIIHTVKDGYRQMQSDIEKICASQHGNMNTSELLDAVEKEFEHVRESITRSLGRETSSADREEILDAIRELSDERGSSLSSSTEDIIRLVKEELEHMRSTLAGTLVRAGSSLDRDEVLEAIREGLETNHRGPPKADGGESMLSNTSELLEAFQEGVDGIRSDMEKLTNRPVDMSNSYEVLDTLKAGLDNVRDDIERLHTTQRDRSDSWTGAKGREVMGPDENMISNEVEGLKVMITQLRIKVEALDIAPTVAENLHQDDFEELRSSLKDVHAAVHQLRETKAAASSASNDDHVATKEDTDAIETLLRNVKAQVEDFRFPDVDEVAKSHHLDSLEDLLRETKSVVEQSGSRSKDEPALREDFGIVEMLLKEVVAGVEELQDKVKVLSSDESRVTKTDVQVVETLCMETKTQLDELTAVDFAGLPDKDDFQTVHNTIKTFQDKIESENELTAQAFEARKIEHGGLANKIDDVKGILSDVRGELIEKLDGSEEGIVELSKVLGHHHESMSKYASAESISELKELVRKEFDKSLEEQKKSNAETEERDAALLFKHDETQGTLSSEISAKIDARFEELMTKYDDAQLSNESKVHSLEERDGRHLEALTSTKAVVDDLKLLIDTLGSTTTEACDRISDDSKTVFHQVSEANTKLDEVQETAVNQHGMTRDEVAKTLAAAMRLEGSIQEHQPAILAAVKEVMTMVSQHYEHSQAHYRHSQSAADEIQSNINAIPSTIPPLLPSLPAPPAPAPLTREVPAGLEYDDSQLHDKLNVLLNHASGAKEALSKVESQASSTKESVASIEKLDQIHDQMVATAGEVSTLVATQTRLMAEQTDSRASEAAEAAIAVEKRVAQKEKVEAEIMGLNSDKLEVSASIQQLKREKDELGGQTKRLTREVAKLETALSIRREEMRDMDLRADMLERRILEGVMDHAKSMNLLSGRPAMAATGPGRKKRAVERDRAMSLKRVPSAASSSISTTTVSNNTSNHGGKAGQNAALSNLGNAVGMALKKRTPLAGTEANAPAVSSRSSGRGGVERRILSTSHVTGNHPRSRGDESTMGMGAAKAPTAPADRALVLAPAPPNSAARNSGLVNLKRSHSVKSNPSTLGAGRNASWNHRPSGGFLGDDFASSGDKENALVLAEEDEGETGSGTETEVETERGFGAGGADEDRRTSSVSGTGSYLSTNDSLIYGTGSIVSYDASSDADGSSTGTVTDAGRSASWLQGSAVGVIGGQEDDASEEDDDVDENSEAEEGVVDPDQQDEDGEATENENHDHGEDKVWKIDESKQVIALVTPPAPSASETDTTSTTHIADNTETYDDDDDDQMTASSPHASHHEAAAAPPPPPTHSDPTPPPASNGDTSPQLDLDLSTLRPPRLFTESRDGRIVLTPNNHNTKTPDGVGFTAGHGHGQYASDSGLGSEPPTADVEKMFGVGGGVGGDYFQR